MQPPIIHLKVKKDQGWARKNVLGIIALLSLFSFVVFIVGLVSVVNIPAYLATRWFLTLIAIAIFFLSVLPSMLVSQTIFFVFGVKTHRKDRPLTRYSFYVMWETGGTIILSLAGVAFIVWQAVTCNQVIDVGPPAVYACSENTLGSRGYMYALTGIILAQVLLTAIHAILLYFTVKALQKVPSSKQVFKIPSKYKAGKIFVGIALAISTVVIALLFAISVLQYGFETAIAYRLMDLTCLYGFLTAITLSIWTLLLPLPVFLISSYHPSAETSITSRGFFFTQIVTMLVVTILTICLTVYYFVTVIMSCAYDPLCTAFPWQVVILAIRIGGVGAMFIFYTAAISFFSASKPT